MSYQLIFSDTTRRFVQIVPNDLRILLKNKLNMLREHPCMGKPLFSKLAGFYSFRSNKLRIIYKVKYEHNIIEVHYIGPRRNIYEIVKQMKGTTGPE